MCIDFIFSRKGKFIDDDISSFYLLTFYNLNYCDMLNVLNENKAEFLDTIFYNKAWSTECPSLYIHTADYQDRMYPYIFVKFKLYIAFITDDLHHNDIYADQTWDKTIVTEKL